LIEELPDDIANPINLLDLTVDDSQSEFEDTEEIWSHDDGDGDDDKSKNTETELIDL
jgi:hypothetical protein